MKIKFFALLIILILSAAGFGQIQSVKVVPKKVFYRRLTDVEYKQKFTITYPKVSGLRNTKLARKIEKSLSYERIFDFDLRTDIESEMMLDKASFSVLYNKNGILNLLLSTDVSAAHDVHSEKSVVVNLNTGDEIKLEDVFIKSKFPELAEKIDKAMQAEIGKTLQEVADTYDDETLNGVKIQFGDDRTFTAEDLSEFSVSDKGVTFIYHYYFSHISRNFEPEGKFFFSFGQLKPFVRRDGLLGKFIK